MTDDEFDRWLFTQSATWPWPANQSRPLDRDDNAELWSRLRSANKNRRITNDFGDSYVPVKAPYRRVKKGATE